MELMALNWSRDMPTQLPAIWWNWFLVPWNWLSAWLTVKWTVLVRRLTTRLVYVFSSLQEPLRYVFILHFVEDAETIRRRRFAVDEVSRVVRTGQSESFVPGLTDTSSLDWNDHRYCVHFMATLLRSKLSVAAGWTLIGFSFHNSPAYVPLIENAEFFRSRVHEFLGRTRRVESRLCSPPFASPLPFRGCPAFTLADQCPLSAKGPWQRSRFPICQRPLGAWPLIPESQIGLVPDLRDRSGWSLSLAESKIVCFPHLLGFAGVALGS